MPPTIDGYTFRGKVTAGGALRREPHTVYQLWAGDQCLYVGVTAHLGTRLQSHRSKEWWPQVTRTETTLCAGRPAGLALERETIKRLRPTHNVRGR